MTKTTSWAVRLTAVCALAIAASITAVFAPTSEVQAQSMGMATPPQPTPAREGATITADGLFVGQSDYAASGAVSVQLSGGKWLIVLDKSFRVDGAPEPIVVMGSNGVDKNAVVAPLHFNHGKQVYHLPSELNIGAYLEVWIWSKELDAPVAVSKLKLR